MYWNILDNSRKELLPFLENFPEFYLAGGTALALKIGHRDSIDFDFFTPKDVNTHQLFNKIKQVFSGKNIQKIQEEWGTLTVLIDNVKVSFFQYNYSLIEDLEKTDYFFLASLSDISAMKCNALVGRATMKDYVDIYFLLNIYSLDQILSFSEQKFPELNRNLV